MTRIKILESSGIVYLSDDAINNIVKNNSDYFLDKLTTGAASLRYVKPYQAKNESLSVIYKHCAASVFMSGNDNQLRMELIKNKGAVLAKLIDNLIAIRDYKIAQNMGAYSNFKNLYGSSVIDVTDNHQSEDFKQAVFLSFIDSLPYNPCNLSDYSSKIHENSHNIDNIEMYCYQFYLHYLTISEDKGSHDFNH